MSDIRGIDISFEIGSEEVELNTKKDILISNNLDKEVDIAAANIAYYGALKAMAKKRLATMKTKYKIWTARHKRSIAEGRERGKLKALTGAMMEAEIRAHPQYLRYKKELIKREEQFDVLESTYESFRDKKAMVRQKVELELEERRGQLKVGEDKVRSHFRRKKDGSVES